MTKPQSSKSAVGLIFPPETELMTLDEFVPINFKQGIEILNDDKTTMEFVVLALEKYLGLDRPSATSVMLKIHNNGGVLLGVPSNQDAARIANELTASAREKGYPLICRAVVAQQGAQEGRAVKPRAT